MSGMLKEGIMIAVSRAMTPSQNPRHVALNTPNRFPRRFFSKDRITTHLYVTRSAREYSVKIRYWLYKLGTTEHRVGQQPTVNFLQRIPKDPLEQDTVKSIVP